MTFNLETINRHAFENPEEFAQECEALFCERVKEAAKMLSERMALSRVAFLSGPSGSGKTTTAKRICTELETHGILGHTFSLDNYYRTPHPETVPRTEDGGYDHESPYCLDLELLNKHSCKLNRSEEIVVPHFSFKLQARDPNKERAMTLGPDEMVIFEGIHALNDMITENHPEAFKIFVSPQSEVKKDGEHLFGGMWMRFMRRVVRDGNFRGTDARETLGMWTNVQLGEKKYILPFSHKADLMFDSSMPYEIPVMKRFALKAFEGIPDIAEGFNELRGLLPALMEFEEIDPAVVPNNSILREFIGGGVYKY